MISLKSRLTQPSAVVAPGVYDALTALLVEQAGFEAVYLSGASVAYSQLGRPDLGLVSVDHLADVTRRICERIELPLIVDADTGFGNALNTQRTVKLLERAGATAIQLEDQGFPKRCGHLKGKTVIPRDEMVGKLKAAMDARSSEQTLIVARTDAIAVEGLEAALDRAALYLDAGVDVLFVEAPESIEDMRRIVELFSGRAPLVANMVEGGSTPILSADALSNLGYRLAICPGALARAVIPQVEALLASLKKHGTTQHFEGPMTDLLGVNQRIGLDALIKTGQRYDDLIQLAI